MKGVFFVVAGLTAFEVIAQNTPRWSEHSRVFVSVAKFSDEAIVAEADAAIKSLGFHRDSSGTTYPGKLVPGIFASYKAHDLAAAILVQASRPGCMVFSATNYDDRFAGLARNAVTAIESRFRQTFGTGVRFFSDPECKLAL